MKIHYKIIQTCRLIGLAGLIGFLPNVSVAADNYVDPSVGIGFEYDDNKTLVSEDPTNVFGPHLLAKALFGTRTERSLVELEALVDTSYYPDEQDLDSTNFFLDLKSYYRTQSSEIGLNGRAIRDTTLRSELEDTGRVQTNTRRDLIEFVPYFQYALSELSTLKLEYSYLDVAYEENELSGAQDYTYQIVDAEYEHNLSEKNLLIAEIGYSDYDSPEAASKADYYFTRVGVKHDFSARMNGTFLAGYYSAQSDFTGGTLESVDSDGPLFLARLEYDFELAEFDIELKRHLRPSSSGQLLDQDRPRNQLATEYDGKDGLLTGSHRTAERAPGTGNRAHLL